MRMRRLTDTVYQSQPSNSEDRANFVELITGLPYRPHLQSGKASESRQTEQKFEIRLTAVDSKCAEFDQVLGVWGHVPSL
jgi:hypothetical protein